jgi:hypothetical protein
VSDRSFYNLLAEKNKICLGAGLILRLVFEIQESPLLALETRVMFRCGSLYSCNILAETINVTPGAVLPSCLVFELQELLSPGIEPRNLSHFLPSYVFFIFSGNKHAKFGANRFIPSLVTVEHTNTCVPISYRRSISKGKHWFLVTETRL